MAKRNIEMQKVNKSTYLMLVDRSPRRVYTTASDLDAAYDAACQFFGMHLDGGAWSTLVSSCDNQEFGQDVVAMLPLKGKQVWSLSVGDE